MVSGIVYSDAAAFPEDHQILQSLKTVTVLFLLKTSLDSSRSPEIQHIVRWASAQFIVDGMSADDILKEFLEEEKPSPEFLAFIKDVKIVVDKLLSTPTIIL